MKMQSPSDHLVRTSLFHGNRVRALGAAVAAVVGALVPLQHASASDDWKAAVGSGFWNTAGNWTLGVPAAAADINIVHNDAVNRVVTYDYTGPNAFNSITLDQTGSGTNAISLPANTLSVGYEIFGNNGSGTFTQSGGTHTVSANQGMYLGYGPTAKGTYHLSSGTLNVALTETVGFQGTGTFNQTGGTNNANNYLYLGYNKTGNGTYNLSNDAVATISSLGYVGVSGTGTFVQTGGTAKFNGDEIVANDIAAVGTVTQSAGANTVAGRLILASVAGGNGTYNLSGGTLTTTSIPRFGAGGTGTFNQTGGTYNATMVTVGAVAGGMGLYSISAGQATLTDNLYLGGVAGFIGGPTSAGGVGLLKATGGSLNAGANTIQVFNTASGTNISGINLAGGSIAAGNLVLPDWNRLTFTSGSLTLSGTSNNTGNLSIGGVGSAVLNQTGGAVTISGSASILNAASAIKLTGGTFSAANLILPGSGGATMLTLGSGATWRHTGATASMDHDYTLDTGGGIIEVQSAAAVLSLGGFGSGAGGLTKTGAGTLKLTGSLSTAAGLTINAGKVDFPSNQSLKALTVGTSGNALISAGVLAIGQNTIASPLNLGAGATAGHLDLTTRGLIVDYIAGAGNDAAALATARSQIINGYNGGTWTGPGITSSAAAANPSTNAVGYALAADVLGAGGGTFMGKPGVDATSVLVRQTLAGDSNLDAAVGFADLVAVAQHYGVNSGATWYQGDFNYDGKVNFSDLVTVAQHYGGVLPTAPIPGASPEFASVPEPSAPLLILGAAVFSVRRRRR